MSIKFWPDTQTGPIESNGLTEPTEMGSTQAQRFRLLQGKKPGSSVSFVDLSMYQRRLSDFSSPMRRRALKDVGRTLQGAVPKEPSSTTTDKSFILTMTL